jgi:hypothetical protein
MTNTDDEYRPLAEHNPQPGDVVEPEPFEQSTIWPDGQYTIQPDGSIIDGEGDAWGGKDKGPESYPFVRHFRVVSRAATAKPAEGAAQ